MDVQITKVVRVFNRNVVCDVKQVGDLWKISSCLHQLPSITSTLFNHSLSEVLILVTSAQPQYTHRLSTVVEFEEGIRRKRFTGISQLTSENRQFCIGCS